MKKLLYLVSIFILTTIINAHDFVLNVIDNKDNTIQVSAKSKLGESAQDAMIRLESLVDAKVLYKERMPDSNKLIIKIPKQPYQIVFDGGPEQQIVHTGIAPLEGFTILSSNKEINDSLSKPREMKKRWGNTTTILFFIAFFLLISTIFLSIRNTNKILKMIKESH